MTLDQGERVRLELPGYYSGMAGRQGNSLAFIVSGRAPKGLVSATIDDSAVMLKVERAPGQERSRQPLILAVIVDRA